MGLPLQYRLDEETQKLLEVLRPGLLRYVQGVKAKTLHQDLRTLEYVVPAVYTRDLFWIYGSKKLSLFLLIATLESQS